MKNKSFYFIWASDISNNTGEGILGRKFLNSILSNKDNILINSYEKKFDLKKISDLNKINFYRTKRSFNHKYFGPLLGILFCWKNYILGKKIIFLNYLPFWNILIFLFLPPKTILGPVTGSKYLGELNSLSAFVRKYIFPIFYYLNSLILMFRYKKVIFSTNLLSIYLPPQKKFFFNFVYTLINSNKFKKKKTQFDIVIYYRNHNTKNSKNLFKVLKLLSKKNYNVCVLGDKLKIKGFKNFGLINNSKVKKILKNSKITFASSENLFSMFIIEAINENLYVLYDNNLSNYNELKNISSLIALNLSNIKKTLYIIDRVIKKKKNINDFSSNKNIKKIRLNYQNFLKDFLN